MRLEAEIKYATDCGRAAQITQDETFQERKCVATGALSHTVSITREGEDTIIHTVRIMPTDDLPDFAKGMVRDGITITETDRWGPAGEDGSRDGTVEVNFHGAPIVMKGALTLRPDGDGAVARLEADLKANIPLFGGKIEKACAQGVLAAVKVEERTAAEWLQ